MSDGKQYREVTYFEFKRIPWTFRHDIEPSLLREYQVREEREKRQEKKRKEEAEARIAARTPAEQAAYDNMSAKVTTVIIGPVVAALTAVFLSVTMPFASTMMAVISALGFSFVGIMAADPEISDFGALLFGFPVAGIATLFLIPKIGRTEVAAVQAIMRSPVLAVVVGLSPTAAYLAIFAILGKLEAALRFDGFLVSLMVIVWGVTQVSAVLSCIKHRG